MLGTVNCTVMIKSVEKAATGRKALTRKDIHHTQLNSVNKRIGTYFEEAAKNLLGESQWAQLPEI